MTENQFSFEELRKVQLAEKHYSVLSPLAEDYYDTYNGYINQYKKQLQTSYDLQNAKVYENAQLIIKDIVNTRLQKIILRSVRDAQTGKLNTEGLARQEKEFYLKSMNLLREYLEAITKMPAVAQDIPMFKPTPVMTQAPITEVKPEAVESNPGGQITVAITIELPQFIGPSGTPIGPFNKGQTITLDEKDANLLIKRGAANKN